MTVQLQNGVGFIGQLSFMDNSSWNRSGRFRLGAKVQSLTDGTNIREAISSALKVKDHRGESYKKHYPPFLYDEVWRLEKIAKDGPSHQRLTQFGISCVEDFLRCNETRPLLLCSVLSNVSKKIQKTIIKHANTCILDDRRFMYKSAQGTGLLFNCIFKVVGVTFDGLSYDSIDNLNMHQMSQRMVEDLKKSAYKNIKDWVAVVDLVLVGYPTLLINPANNFSHPNSGIQDAHFQVEHDQLEMQMNNQHSTISSPSDLEVEQDNKGNSFFEIGEGSQVQEFNLSFRTKFHPSDSPDIFYGHTWILKANYMASQLSTEDLPINENAANMKNG